MIAARAPLPQPGPLILSTALRDACFQDPDKCVFGDMLARSVAGGDNAFVVSASAPRIARVCRSQTLASRRHRIVDRSRDHILDRSRDSSRDRSRDRCRDPCLDRRRDRRRDRQPRAPVTAPRAMTDASMRSARALRIGLNAPR